MVYIVHTSLPSQIEQQDSADKGSSSSGLGHPNLPSCDMLATISDDEDDDVNDNEKVKSDVVEEHDDHDKENVEMKNSDELTSKPAIHRRKLVLLMAIVVVVLAVKVVVVGVVVIPTCRRSL